MKSALLLLIGGLLVGLGYPAQAQDFINTGTLVTVQPGGSIYVGTGGLRNQAGGTITNGGTLRVDGLLTNAGTLNLSTGALEVRADVTNSGTVTPGTSSVTFSGTTNQLLTPAGATFYQVLVNKPAATTLRLAGDVTINRLLQLTSGYVNTQAPGGTVYTLRLPDGASLSGEASGRYVQGSVQVTRNAVSGAAVGFGLGVILDPDGNNLGAVSVTRTAGLQLADVSYGQNLGSSPKGIDRIWTVTPTTQPSTPVDLTLSWLPDNDNGLVGFSQVQLWQQPTTGQPWTAVGPVANASIRLFSSSLTVLNRFTVSNNSSAVPVASLVSFSPNSGPAGSTFAIAGTNLGGATTITFTPTSGPATAVTSGFVVAGSTSITGVPVPAGLAAGAYTVTVTTADGVSNGLPFTVTTSASTAAPVVTAPTQNQVLATATPTYAGTAPAGSTVTVYVNGTSIGTTTAVGGSFSLVQPTALPAGAYTVYATAQLSGQAVSANSTSIAFTVGATPTQPTLTLLSPNTGPVGTSVTITGTNLSGATAVSFNGTAASSFVVNSATSITAVVAAGTTTGPVSVTTPGGTATSATSFVVRVAPTTVADTYTTPQNVLLTGNVLSNDIGTNPRAILIIQPTHGTLALNPDGSFTYQPAAGYSGPDSFIYYACDPALPLLCGNPATVSITVQGTAPTTVSDSYTTQQGVALAGNVLSNDLGTNPQAILIIRPTHGTLLLNPNGTFTYQPAAGYLGPDSFIYYACNMGAPLVCGAPATVSISVVPAYNSRPASSSGAAVAGGAPSALELPLTGSPNPFTYQLTVSFALPTAQAYTLALYDAQGRLVQQLASGEAPAGQLQQVEVPTHAYAAGLYLMRLSTASGTQLLKLIKQ